MKRKAWRRLRRCGTSFLEQEEARGTKGKGEFLGFKVSALDFKLANGFLSNSRLI